MLPEPGTAEPQLGSSFKFGSSRRGRYGRGCISYCGYAGLLRATGQCLSDSLPAAVLELMDAKLHQ